MTFSYVDLNTISDEEYEYLLSINKWLDKDILTQVYVVKDQNDIKSVFCLKQRNRYVGAELCFETKESERNKGYCSFGFYRILDVIKRKPHLEEVLIISIDTEEFLYNPSNKITDRLCKKAKIPPVIGNIYCFSNPNFNPKYRKLEKMVKIGIAFEEIVDFCDNDEVMLSILDIWMKKVREKEPNKRIYR